MDEKQRISALAEAMDEFGLAEARLTLDGFTVGFRRKIAAPVAVQGAVATLDAATFESELDPIPVTPVVAAPTGLPVKSPMPGIFYPSPSPGSAPFVKEGDEVVAGQIVGLIEAMKVFNEIPSPVSGVVKSYVAHAGQLVQPGDVLLWIE